MSSSNSRRLSATACTAVEWCVREAVEEGDPRAVPVLDGAHEAPSHEGLPYAVLEELGKSVQENGLQHAHSPITTPGLCTARTRLRPLGCANPLGTQPGPGTAPALTRPGSPPCQAFPPPALGTEDRSLPRCSCPSLLLGRWPVRLCALGSPFLQRCAPSSLSLFSFSPGFFSLSPVHDK